MQEILVVCAHSDDQIIGPGGTIAKYAEEGYTIRTVIFSYGVLSHPHLKENVIADVRKKEALKADKIIGGKSVEIIGVPEGKFLEQEYSKQAHKRLKVLIKTHKPKKIFTHSPDDPHGDHRAVFRQVLRAYDDLKPKTEVYSFDVWNFFSLSTRGHPKLVVDVTETFPKKLKAIREFQSQKVTFVTMIWAVYLRAFFQGIRHKKKFAEVFRRLR
jgi:LmbE family N-acetylglucosaminyl deacetylase